MPESHRGNKKGDKILSFSSSEKAYKATERSKPQHTQKRERNAKEKPNQAKRHSKRSVARKPGRPKKPRQRGGAHSMGRYPFTALLKDFLAQRRIAWSESTYDERERKYRYLNRVFANLKSEGKIDTMNPTKFTEKEVYAFEAWMRERGLDSATKVKYRGLIKDFLLWNDNYVYDKLVRKGYILTQRPQKEIVTIEEEEFQTLLNHARQNRKTWPQHVAYFLTAMYGYLGLRNKELRLSDLEDLNTSQWTFLVKHPKGENRYGKKRTIPVVEPLRPIIQEYLQIREQHLKKYGISNVQPLIPSVKKRKGNITISHYSGNRLRVIARDLSKSSGIPFQIKVLRASCGQALKDRNAGIEAVSKFLGHGSTETTERFYARLRDKAMFREINSLYPEKGRGAISNLIEKDKYISGYA